MLHKKRKSVVHPKEMWKYEVSHNAGKFAAAGNLSPRKAPQTPAREFGIKQPIKCPLFGGF
jgi:hypothetical protein